LEALYHNKCAYCEGLVNEGSYLQVEHYRPKKKVTEDVQHSGYYWLAYEWSNLLWSCQKCNGKKLNKFPIAGVRVRHPHSDSLQWQIDSTNEKPLLLNPELDDPTQHFDFEPDGTLVAKTSEGVKTIEVCDLNRESLKIARKKILDDAISSLCDQLEIFLRQPLDTPEKYNDAIELGFKTDILKLKKAMQPQQPYSAFSTCLFHDFERFVCQSIAGAVDQAFSEVLNKAYKQFAN
jgi:uncharacterized protein (TIGR02646 family)